MVGNMMNKTEMKMRGFKRAFHFSDGVILDGIKVRFNEQEFVLTILIPKLERGFRGTRVEEVKQEEIGGTYEPLCIEENRVDEIKTLGDEKLREVDFKEEKDTDGDVVEVHKEELKKVEIVQELDQTQTYPMETFKDQGFEGKQDNINPNEVQHVQEPEQIPSDPLEAINYRGFEGEEGKKKIENEDEGVKKDEKKKIENEDEGVKRDEKKKIESEDEGLKRDEKKKIEDEDEGLKRDESPKIKKNKCKLCEPLILGSTVLLTISVLVIYLLRNQNPHGKKKN